MEKKNIVVVVDSCLSARAAEFTTVFDGTLREAAESAAEDFRRLSRSDREDRDAVYVYEVPACRPKSSEEKDELEELASENKAYEIDDGWFVETPELGAPEDYAIDSIDVAANGQLVAGWEE